MTLETLEARLLMATLPTPQVGATVNLSSQLGFGGTNQQNEGTPTLVIDPQNSQKMVAVYQISNSTTNLGDSQTPITTFVGAAFSVNGGTTWQSLNIGQQTYHRLHEGPAGGPLLLHPGHRPERRLRRPG